VGPDLVLNDLSVTPAENVHHARQLMNLFVNTLRGAVDMGTSPKLRRHHTTQAQFLAPHYSIPQWQADHEVDRLQREYLLTLDHMAPPLRDRPESQEEMDRSEYLFQGVPAEALGIAVMIGGLSVSFLSNPCWDTHELYLDRKRLWIDGEFESEARVMARHAATPAHALRHAQWVDAVIKGRVRNGNMLWESRQAIFPSLDFCEKSRKYILGRGYDPVLRALLRGFSSLERFSRQWQPGQPFDYRRIDGDVSPDSPSTLQQYGEERTYRCSDGVERTFSYHLKLGDGWRIYLHEDAGPGRLYIGPVGRHLKTVRFRS